MSSSPFGKKLEYNTIDDFYLEEMGRDIEIALTTLKRMLNMLDKMKERTDVKNWLFQASGLVKLVKADLFPDDELTE
jgi:hypothetical protein